MNFESNEQFSGAIALYHGQDKSMEVRQATWPRPQGEEALVKITHCAICRSDVHTMCGRRTVHTPTVLGHEMIGNIVATGDNFPKTDICGETIAIGDRITWAIYAHCGKCFYCKTGIPQKCENLFKYGHESVSMDGSNSSGGMASYIILRPGTPILKLPEEIHNFIATPINCAVSTAAAMLRESQVKINASSTLLVMGGGYAGLSAVALAKRQGCGHVLVVEPNRERHQRCLDFGADSVCAPGDESAESFIQISTSGRGVDLALELAGSSEAAQLALGQLRIGGTLVLAGTVFPSPPLKIDPDQIVRRCLTIKGVHNYRPEDLIVATRCILDTKDSVPWNQLIGAEFQLERVDSAVAFAKDNPGLRSIIHPPH